MSTIEKTEPALREAIVQALKNDDYIKNVFGDRLFSKSGMTPAYPYMEIARHRSEDAGSDAAPALEHRIDINIFSRRKADEEIDVALTGIRRVLDADKISATGFNLVLLFPIFADTMTMRDGQTLRATIRLRAVTEPAI